MPAILDLLIGLTFLFLLFSLVVTAANEIWLSFLDQRTRFLRQGLRELFHEYHHCPLPGWIASLRIKLFGKPARPAGPAAASLLGDFYAHGLVNALSRGQNERPSYIAPEIFVIALVDLLIKRGPRTAGTRSQKLAGGIDALKTTNPHFAASLQALLDAAEGDIQQFQAGLGRWFEDSMNRVSGWYKRYAQQWLLALGLLLAIACNADTLRIARTLTTDPKVRESLVEAAIRRQPEGGEPDAGTLRALQKSVSELGGFGIPLGWDESSWLYFFKRPGGGPDIGRIVTALFGWILTALAASLGAPFWFDTLNRFINIRGNGRAPEEPRLQAKRTV
ncbi:MAG: hypothetical protein PHC88_04750 [Terrimicrobiaceae bacterium]|nr:hypothetical protein [Terrimicrobiaceae bacterium]